MNSNIYGFIRYNFWPGGREIRQQLENLERTQWLSPEELKNLQFEKVQRLISYAYDHVPFYRKRFLDADIHPEDIKSLQDFQAIPFLTRDDVVNHKDELLSKEYSGKFFKSSTGGSTGKAMQFYMDEATSLWSAAVEIRNRRWYGIKPGHKRAWVWGSSIAYHSEGHWKRRLEARIKRYRHLQPRFMDNDKMRAFAEMLVEWKPDMFRGYPSAMYLFARFIKEEGITGIQPKFIETSAEKLLPHQRSLISEVFKAPIAEAYQSWELLTIAYQCPEGGYHVSEDRYLELVANGKVVQPGELGETVITSLNQYGMPFIRYKNDDLGIYEPNNCTCGRCMPILREVTGRVWDCLVDTDGSVVHWSSIAHIIVQKFKGDKPEVLQYQFHQLDREHIEVRLVRNKDVKSTLCEDVRNELKPCFDEAMQITVKLVDKIDLTQAGKFRPVISDVRPSFLYSEHINNNS